MSAGPAATTHGPAVRTGSQNQAAAKAAARTSVAAVASATILYLRNSCKRASMKDDCTPDPDVSKEPAMRSTQEVLDHHLDCFGRADLEGILADYSATAVMFTPTGPLKGPAAMRPFFEAIFAEFGRPGTSFSMIHRSVDGDCAYILWSAETAENVYELGTDTFVVRNDQITAHSFALKIRAKG
jgi:ketosteroid isomerase-like protein